MIAGDAFSVGVVGIVDDERSKPTPSSLLERIERLDIKLAHEVHHSLIDKVSLLI